MKNKIYIYLVNMSFYMYWFSLLVDIVLITKNISISIANLHTCELQ